MYDALLAAAITGATLAGSFYVFLRIRELPDSYRAQGIDAHLADRVFTHRIQWLFLVLFAIAGCTIAMNAYQALRPSNSSGAELPRLESKVDATRSDVKATQQQLESTQTRVAEAQSTIDKRITDAQSTINRIEKLIEGVVTPGPAATTTRIDLNPYGEVLVAFIVLGALLFVAGLFIDFRRAQPGEDPQSKKGSSSWSMLLQSAALLKISGTFCLIGSVTVASFKFDSFVKFTTADAPAEIQVSLLHFVDQVTSKQPVEIRDPPPHTTPPTDPPPTKVKTGPAPLPMTRTTEVDCGDEAENERFVVKTFKLGKNDELEDQIDPKDKLDAILDAIERGAKERELQGIVFIGSADRLGLGKASREQYGTNSILARKRAEFIRKRFNDRLALRKDGLQPHWILLLNPDVPRVRLTIDDGKQFDALRAVQICVAWTKSDEIEGSRL